MEKLNLSDYKIKISEGRDLKKNQRLALEIIREFKVEPKQQGRWFRACKNCPAFIEDKLISIRGNKNIKNPAAYLWRLIYNNKICNL